MQLSQCRKGNPDSRLWWKTLVFRVPFLSTWLLLEHQKFVFHACTSDKSWIWSHIKTNSTKRKCGHLHLIKLSVEIVQKMNRQISKFRFRLLTCWVSADRLKQYHCDLELQSLCADVKQASMTYSTMWFNSPRKFPWSVVFQPREVESTFDLLVLRSPLFYTDSKSSPEWYRFGCNSLTILNIQNL